MAWLLRASPYSEAISATVALYFSDVGFTTEPGDSPSNTYWNRRIEVPLTFSQSLYNGTSAGGISDVSLGAITLANGDGELDGLALYDWDGRMVELLYSDKEFPTFSDFTVSFSGVAERLVLGDEISIEIRDLQLLLDEPYQTARFLGTGGIEGPAEFLDRRKPRLIGVRRQFTPVVLDPANLVWCYHDGPVGAVFDVKDSGVPLPFNANYATYAALIAAAIPSGYYGTCTALGLIRLNSQPVGVLTLSAEGAKPGATTPKSFADLCVYAVERATSLTSADFAAGTVASLNAAAGATLGHWYDGTADLTLRELLDELAMSVGAFYGFNIDRKIVLGRLDEPAVVADHSFDARDLIRIEPAAVERRLKTQTVAWGQLGRPLQDEEIAGVVTGSARTALSEEWRQERFESASVSSACLLAREERLDSAFDLAADAQAEAARRVSLYGPLRSAYSIEVPLLSTIRPGQTIKLTYERFGLSGGKHFRLLRLETDAARQTMNLELWG